MMIYDRFDFFSHYFVFSPDAKARIRDWMRKLTPDMPAGKTELDGSDVFGSISTYQTKTDLMQAMPETHREYADIQFLLEGEEDIYVGDASKLTENAPYKPDCTLYHNDGSFLTRCRMTPGVFAIFFPGEGHLPCIAVDGVSRPVKKVVVKVSRKCLNF